MLLDIVTWSDVFVANADPLSFDPTLDLDLWQQSNTLVDPDPRLDGVLDAVVGKINQEAKRINPNYTTTKGKLQTTVAGDLSSMSYQERFQALVDAGERELRTLRNGSVDSADFKAFYQRYYLYPITTDQLKQVKEFFNSQDYGFGLEVQQNEKQSALNRSIQYGLIPEDTSLVDYENFVDPVNRQSFKERLLKINGSGGQAIVDPALIDKDPLTAADALLRLRESGKLEQDSKGQYQWSKGNDWRALEGFNDGALLNSYQKLLLGYEKSDERKQGLSLSQYIATANKTVFNQISNKVAESKLKLDTSRGSLNEAQAEIESAMKKELDRTVNEIGLSDSSTQEKIAALRADVFKQASYKLSQQKNTEMIRGGTESIGELNGLFQDMAQEFGLKPDFFSSKSLQSNIGFNWQRWFEEELRSRYNPDNPNNALTRIIGNTEEDAKLAATFVQDFLQRRFDASKSLSEFTNYVDPTAPNPVLEKDYQNTWQSFTSKSFDQLAGSIADPNSILGNFWTNLQSLWSKGRSFDASYYLSQILNQSNNTAVSVRDLHGNLQLINDVAARKGTTQLSGDDLKGLPLKGVDTSSKTALDQQAQLYRQWFETAYANGVDLNDPTEFAKLHFTTYTKDLTNPILQLEGGRQLSINDTSLISSEESKLLQQQVGYLAKQAEDYASQIRFGTFKTPEEYVAEVVKNSPMAKLSQDGLWKGTGLTDIMSEFVSQFSGVISSYAGEVIRQQIRNVIDQGVRPDQSQLGVDYIQRTKDQALSTIRNLINQDAYRDAVVIDNAPGVAVGQSMRQWFSDLGLELIPGDTWNKYKAANGIPPATSYEDWEKSQGQSIDPSTNKPVSQLFWEQWAKDNGIQVVSSGSSTDPRLSVVVSDPSSAWLAWGKRITNEAQSGGQETTTKLKGAQVKVRSDQFNADWYSKTNPYSQVVSDWNTVVTKPNQSVIDTKGQSLGQWAKQSGLSPEDTWNAYREEKQKSDPSFGKDSLGNDMSYVSWSQSAGDQAVTQFWGDSTPFWYDYLKNLGVIKSGSVDKPQFKTWSEWAIENNVSLERANTTSNPPPTAFMQLHYATLGGKSRVDDEYLRVYFPEFTELETAGIARQGALKESPFDLSAFGFNDDFSFNALQSVTGSANSKTGRTSRSPIDFMMADIFGDTLKADLSDPFADITGDLASASNDFGVNLDKSYNTTTTKKKVNQLSGFGFGDFGGSAFGF